MEGMKMREPKEFPEWRLPKRSVCRGCPHLNDPCPAHDDLWNDVNEFTVRCIWQGSKSQRTWVASELDLIG